MECFDSRVARRLGVLFVGVAAISLALFVSPSGAAADDFIPRRQEKPPGPPLAPAEAMAKMTLPEGFSVVDAAGPRTDKPMANLFLSEPSKIIIIIVADGPETEQRIAAVEAAYKKQFQQQSVVVASRAVCASF